MKHTMQIQRGDGVWFLKWDSQIGWVFGFLKTGKKRCSIGLFQLSGEIFNRKDLVELAKQDFQNRVQMYEKNERKVS